AAECRQGKRYARGAAKPKWRRRSSATNDLGGDRGRLADRLQHDAIAFGELKQLLLLLLARVAVELEFQRNVAETDRRVLRHAERATEIEIALGDNFCISYFYL